MSEFNHDGRWDAVVYRSISERERKEIEARKDFGGARPTPPAYSLEELEHASEFAKAKVDPPHFRGPLNNA